MRYFIAYLLCCFTTLGYSQNKPTIKQLHIYGSNPVLKQVPHSYFHPVIANYFHPEHLISNSKKTKRGLKDYSLERTDSTFFCQIQLLPQFYHLQLPFALHDTFHLELDVHSDTSICLDHFTSYQYQLISSSQALLNDIQAGDKISYLLIEFSCMNNFQTLESYYAINQHQLHAVKVSTASKRLVKNKLISSEALQELEKRLITEFSHKNNKEAISKGALLIICKNRLYKIYKITRPNSARLKQLFVGHVH